MTTISGPKSTIRGSRDGTGITRGKLVMFEVAESNEIALRNCKTSTSEIHSCFTAVVSFVAVSKGPCEESMLRRE